MKNSERSSIWTNNCKNSPMGCFLFFKGDNFMNINDYRYKYDLHVHTSPVSACGDLTPCEVVNRYAELGFQGVVITNHFSESVLRGFKTKEDFLEYYLNDYRNAVENGKKHGLQVFLGLEIRFPENNNDYLVYGIDETDVLCAYDYIFTDYETFYREFKTDKNLIVQAHPFRSSCSLQQLDIIDGIEVYNMHPGHNSRVALAAKLVHDNPRLCVTGGTDFHHEGHQGMCAMCLKEKVCDSIALADAIRARDYIFDIWGNKIIPDNK